MCVSLYSIPYFQRPYKDSDYLSVITRDINNTLYTVYRPNHGIAHSLRQSFLARDVISVILQHPNHPFHSSLQYNIINDPNFATKVSIISSFQRSGRESEVSSTADPVLYARYQEQDIINFMEAVDLKYFCCRSCMERWSVCLRWENTSPLSTILKIAHTLDLRRIPNFDTQRIKQETAELLQTTPNSEVMGVLWNQSGRYLEVSGDRDAVTQKEYWSNRSFTLQQDPCRLYLALKDQLWMNS